uniref:CSON006060 protein n=1 Tax=Culicoides sonorensis TaxID=179676 RepID=A0A336MUH8_CULSO
MTIQSLIFGRYPHAETIELSIIFFFEIFGLVADVLLIIGSAHKKPKYLQFFLVIMFFVNIYDVGYLIFWLISDFGDWGYGLIEFGLFILYDIYIWFCAHSLNQSWKDGLTDVDGV